MSFWAPFASLRASSSLVILSEAKNPFHSALRVNSAKYLLFILNGKNLDCSPALRDQNDMAQTIIQKVPKARRRRCEAPRAPALRCAPKTRRRPRPHPGHFRSTLRYLREKPRRWIPTRRGK